VQGADLGLFGEKGVKDLRGNFIPGSSGADWPYPNGQDLNRLKTQEKRAEENKMLWEHSKIILNRTSWTAVSWSQVNCCQRLVDKTIWEDISTGVPDCFCRDILVQSGYKTTAICNLQQACENALRDFNRVFGEGYLNFVQSGNAHVWDTESPVRSCQYSRYGGGWYSAPCGRKNTKPGALPWKDPYGRETVGIYFKHPYGRETSALNSLVAYQCHTCIFVLRRLIIS